MSIQHADPPTSEQTAVLAALERKHGMVARIPDDHKAIAEPFANCLTGTRVYQCRRCRGVWAIEPDGTTESWAWVRPRA